MIDEKEKNLLFNKKNGVGRIILNRPSSYNSLSTDLLNKLTDTFRAIEEQEDVRVVIIEGSGNGFCAGHDLNELRSINDQEKHKKIFKICSEMMISIMHLSKPVIAKVHGSATAAGCQLVATCDLAICSNDATFATPGVQIGLFCSTPMVALSRNINRKQSMAMLLTGEKVSAEKAKEIGLVNDCVAKDKLETKVLELANKISSKSRKSVKIGKGAFYKQLEMGISDSYDFTSQIMAENMMAHDAKEGISAFIEKRTPEWQDK